MSVSLARLALAATILFASVSHVDAQSTKFHLHKETSVTGPGIRRLQTINPEPGTVALQSPDLKNVTSSAYHFVEFDTANLLPSTKGTIPAQSVISVKLWMKKTANWGQFNPRFTLFLNDSSGGEFCTGTATGQLTTALQPFTASCTTQNPTVVNTTDRYTLSVGVSIAAGAGSHSVKAELDIEGVAEGNYDSWITIPTPPPPPPPAPVLSDVSPIGGVPNSTVTLTGTNFGSAAGTVKFNNVTASPTNWSDGTITVPVPASAATGPVQVTTTAGSSNTLMFTVWTSGAIAGTVTLTTGGQPVSGALVEVLQSGVVKATRTTPTGGTYSVTGLTSGVYDVRVSLTGLVPVLRTNLTVAASTLTVDVALSSPGTITGAVNMSGGSTPISGASVVASQEGVDTASTVTDGAGAYSLPGLSPGTYTVTTASSGYVSQSQTGVSVTENGTANVTFALAAATPPAIRFVYDELGRLAAAVDLNGETAQYGYDATGNITSITRRSSGTLSLMAFSPHSGPAGTTVRLSGTGFSTVAASNTVTFGGIAATVTSASNTSLLVTVPAGVPVGAASIAVAVGSSSVNGATNFQVTAPPDLNLIALSQVIEGAVRRAAMRPLAIGTSR
jgi:YD repeat-containing protein